jgi:hypothetical protein
LYLCLIVDISTLLKVSWFVFMLENIFYWYQNNLYFRLYFIDTGILLKEFRFVFFAKCWYRNTFKSVRTLLKVFKFVFVPWKIYFIDTGTLFKVFWFVFSPIFYWYRTTLKSVPVCIFVPYCWYQNTLKNVPFCIFA